MGLVADILSLMGISAGGPKTTKATLAGVPLLMDKPLRWRTTEGVKPVIEQFDVPLEELPFWLEKSRALEKVTLVFDAGPDSSATKAGHTKPLIEEGLYVIKAGVAPDDSRLGRIEVADRRIWWDFTHTLRRYNMRRAVGAKVRRTFSSAVLDTLAADIAYAAYSLPEKTGKISEAWDVLAIILDNLHESDTLGLGADEVDVESGVLLLTARSTESLELDGASDNELQRALRQLPGVGIYVKSGKVVLKDKTDKAGEVKNLGLGGPAIHLGGSTKFVSYAALRAKKCRCLFTINAEVRCDQIPREPGTSLPPDDFPRLVPVVRSPWPDLEVDGIKVPQGGYVDLHRLLPALNALAKPIGGLIKLSLDLLGELNYPGEGWGWITSLAGRTSLIDEDDRNWSKMIAAIKHDAWRTYRISRRFWDRCLSVSNRLVSGLDQENALRAAAQVFANHTLFPSHQGRGAALLGQGVLHLDNPVEGYPKGAANGLGFASMVGGETPSPFRVEIADPEQGIIRIEDLEDQTGNTESQTLGLGVDGPIYDPSKEGALSLIFGGVPFGDEDKVPRIDPGTVKIAVVLSFVPAAPNGKAQLWHVDVDPADLKELLPFDMHASLDDSDVGPEFKELRCPPSVEVCRIRYRDDKATEIARLFGIDGLEPVDQEELLGADGVVLNDFPELIIPGDLTTPAASLNKIAQAMAAAYYFSLRDRTEGSRTTILHGDKVPAGNIDEIVHTVSTDGIPTSFLRMPSRPVELSFWDFLDAGTRKILNKEVDLQT